MHRKKRKTIFKQHKGHRHINSMIEKVLESKSFSASAARTLLALLAFGGIMVIGAMAPNIFSSFGHFGKDQGFDKQFNKRKVQYSVSYLRKKKFITCMKKEDNAHFIKITKDGIQRVRHFIMNELAIEKPLVWDGRWRVVIFDIPEKLAVARNALRRKLRELEFFQLQRSVFIYPYPAEDEILFIASLFDVERYIELLTVEKMLYDKELCSHFKIRR